MSHPPARTPFRTSHPRFDAVICDIDGCLSEETSTPFDRASLDRIGEHNRLAQERRDRPVLTVCSGRPQPFAEAMSRLLGNQTLPLIAENGVWLYIPGDNLYEMDPGITREHLRAVRDAGEWLAEEFGPRGVSQQPGKTASVSLYHPDTDYLRSIVPRITEVFAERRWPMRVSMTWFYINCDLRHVTKGTGIDRLLARTGLDPHRVAGIGDTGSDLVMLEKLGWFGCPGNAAPEIRDRADFVAEKSVAEGVIQILAEVIRV
jgi:hydroxymethylpyrimidine pyrophosphatase-like HAD family hydrolase